ncbi:hypothetical protein HJG60_011360 [Phyllostomus discolor]|uniref:Uncharacterized protein n=1 Tax=Phyllostomus discolor TaxID=89673 RepID=A0A834A4K1_9CHIR|nr:hypothetical protein HJG60_011360 [Phyllostomus discolor]
MGAQWWQRGLEAPSPARPQLLLCSDSSVDQMAEPKYTSSRGSASWSHAQQRRVGVGCVISKTWALTQGFSRPRGDKQMNYFFQAVTPSPGGGRLFTEWDLEKKKTPVGQKWRPAEVFGCRWMMILLMKEDEQQVCSESEIWVAS